MTFVLSVTAVRGRPYTAPEGEALRRAVASALGGENNNALPGREELAGFGILAGQLRQVFAAVEDKNIDRAVGGVNTLLRQSGAAPCLDRHGTGPWHLHFHGRSADPVTAWTAVGATALAVALGSELAERLGVCHAPACGPVFFDESRNGSRRYCSLACQSRTKAGAHRARLASAAGLAHNRGFPPKAAPIDR